MPFAWWVGACGGPDAVLNIPLGVKYSRRACPWKGTVVDMDRRTFRTVVSAFAVVGASALLTGCFTFEAKINISDDATADLDYLVLIDTAQLEEFSGLLGEELGDMGDLSGDALLQEAFGEDDPCAELTSEFTTFEVSTRNIDENGEVGVGCTVTGVPIADLTSLGDDTSSFSIVQDDAGTRFNAVLEGVDELAGDPSETEMLTDIIGVSFDDLFTIRFVVTAPGSLGDNNASSTDGSTATWDIKPDADFVADGDATMTAEWTPGGGGGGSSTWIILLAIAAIAAVIAIAVVLVKRSKGQPAEVVSDDSTSPPDMSPTTAAGTPPPPPPPPPPGMTPQPAVDAPPTSSPAPPIAAEPPAAPPPSTPPPPPPPPPS